MTSGEASAANGPAPVDGAPPVRAELLEERVRRLEDAVAHLQDTKQLEERIAERLSSRLTRNSSEAIQESPPARGKRPPPTATFAPAPTETNHATDAQKAVPTGWRGWLLFVEAYQEARTFIRMYLDRRYRPTWLGTVGPPAILLMILLSYFWIPFTSILPAVLERPLEKIVDLVLAFLLLKILHREACRYRATIPNAH